MIGEGPKMSRHDVRNYVVFPAIGGAILGLIGYTVCVDIPERVHEQSHTGEFVMVNESLFGTVASQDS